MSNSIIIESQETGKTTHLFNEVTRLVSEGKNVIIMDSATEHTSKSLLRKVENTFSNVITFNMTDEERIVMGQDIPDSFEGIFPCEEVLDNKGKIIGFDLSYFLEMGHEEYDKTGDIDLYNRYRNLYRNLSHQIAAGLISLNQSGLLDNTIVVMDEIEFPTTPYDISLSQGDITFIGAVHPENSFGTFYKSFEKEKFQIYRKEV